MRSMPDMQTNLNYAGEVVKALQVLDNGEYLITPNISVVARKSRYVNDGSLEFLLHKYQKLPTVKELLGARLDIHIRHRDEVGCIIVYSDGIIGTDIGDDMSKVEQEFSHQILSYLEEYGFKNVIYEKNKVEHEKIPIVATSKTQPSSQER